MSDAAVKAAKGGISLVIVSFTLPLAAIDTLRHSREEDLPRPRPYPNTIDHNSAFVIPAQAGIQ